MTTDWASDLGHPLMTEDQRALESEAMRIAALLPAGTAEALAAELLGLDTAATPIGKADLVGYLSELVRCTALQSANSDPFRPRVLWNLFTGARAGLDNPDTLYRFIPVAAHSTYAVHGRRGTSTDVSFQLFDGWQGDGVIGQELGFLGADDLVVQSDGTFTITLGRDDANPDGARSNHIQLPPDAAQLTIRDTSADWDLAPMLLRVERTSRDNPKRARTTEQLVATTVRRLGLQAPFWPPIVEAFRSLVPNTVGRPDPTPGGLSNQCSAPGHFVLAEDEAMVVELGRGGAGYQGIELANLQFTSLEHLDHASSRNPAQSVADPDGRTTYVIAHEDPGVANWLDPVGHHEGIIFLRWQGLAGPLDAADHPRALVCTVAELDTYLAPDTARVTPDERAAELARRRTQLERRRGLTLST